MSNAWGDGDFASGGVAGLGGAIVAVAGIAGLGGALAANAGGATGRGFAGVAGPLALFVWACPRCGTPKDNNNPITKVPAI